ncbi:MAG: hypothetical protein AB3N63_10175 [Puniceicoccaceae bacterium]
MPFSLEHILVYTIVLLVLFYLGRRFWCAVTEKGTCSKNCDCPKSNEIKRDPVIQDYLKKHKD